MLDLFVPEVISSYLYQHKILKIKILGINDFLGDLQQFGQQYAVNLFQARFKGLQLLMKRIGKENMDFIQNGSYQIMLEGEQVTQAEIDKANEILFPFHNQQIYFERSERMKEFGFNTNYFQQMVENTLQGQIDTGLAVRQLYQIAVSLGALYLTGAEMESYQYQEKGKYYQIKVQNNLNSKEPFIFKSKDLAVCINGFMKNLYPQEECYPRRGQIIITNPIQDLQVKGVFFFQHDTYFRDFHGRLLIGGGRHMDFENESTDKIENSSKILNFLHESLKTHIIPNIQYQVDVQWAGILGFNKNPNILSDIVQRRDDGVVIAGRCCGVGVALTSSWANEMSNILYGQQEKLRPKL